MKKALIDPNGNFVEVAASEFPVAPPFVWVDVSDDVTPQTHVWDGSAVVLKPTPAPDEQALIESIKRTAQARIYKRIPAWKQANLTARSAELLRIRLDSGAWTDQQQQEVDEIDAVWAWAKLIRAHSATLEQQVLSGNSPDITSGWPE